MISKQVNEEVTALIGNTLCHALPPWVRAQTLAYQVATFSPTLSTKVLRTQTASVCN